MSSFFPWMGGKSKMVKTILPLIAAHKCYAEVFAGAANLLFAKEKSETEVINDINSDLVNLFNVVKFHRREFIRQLSLLCCSRELFEQFTAQPGVTDIQRAASYWYALKSCYGGRITERSFGYSATGRARFNRLCFSQLNRCHKRLASVYIEHLDFADLIKRYDRSYTLFYCDPPYLDTAGYGNQFGLAEHKQLAGILKTIKGKFLLSINDHKDIVSLYKGFNIKRISVRYTVSLDKSSKATNRSELLIANYQLKNKT